MDNSSHTQIQRDDILARLSAIFTMDRGTLAEEYREHTASHGKEVVRLGPYFKYQLWQDGRNLSRRVPAAEAGQLREDIDNAKHFHQLTFQLAQLNIEHTLALRAAETSSSADARDAKKNSTKKQLSKGSTKPKPSSRKPKRS